MDPFCGSGTIPIEAAMMAANIAPGMNREFTAEQWTNLIDRKYWYEAIDEAHDQMDTNIETDIQGYDIDGDVLKTARRNAADAGVDHLIHFSAPGSQSAEPSGEIWIYHYESSLWRKAGRKGSASETVQRIRREFPKAGYVVCLYDYQL